MGDMNHADSLVLFICAEWQSKKWYRYIFWFLFNVFFCNAFVLESECVGLKGKTLDFKLDRTHQHQQSMVSRNERKSVDGTKFQTEPCYTPKSICSACMEGRKRKCIKCLTRVKNTQGLQSGNKSGIFVIFFKISLGFL